MTPYIKTDRLILRGLNFSDQERIFLIRSDDEVIKYLGRPKAASIADAQDFISKILIKSELNAVYYWGVTLPENDLLIGTVCLWNFTDDKKEADIGYELLPEFQGKGYMSESVQAVLNYIFNNLPVNLISAVFSPGNAASLKLLKKLNFSDAGILTEDNEVLSRYILTKDDWKRWFL